MRQERSPAVGAGWERSPAPFAEAARTRQALRTEFFWRVFWSRARSASSQKWVSWSSSSSKGKAIKTETNARWRATRAQNLSGNRKLRAKAG